MVGLLSEFVAAPGQSDVVCAALDVTSIADCSCMRTIVASDADAPRRVFVLHLFADEHDASRFHDDVLPGLVHSVRAHIDMAIPLRRMNITGERAAALAA
jgi:hypothetical protein